MRRVTFGGANSLDNIIARPDHAIDCLLKCDKAHVLMADYWNYRRRGSEGLSGLHEAVGDVLGWPGDTAVFFHQLLSCRPGHLP